MHLNQYLSCKVCLLGSLQDKPSLMMDEKGDFIAIILVNKIREPHFLYRVFIDGDAALRMRQYGFIGLPLWIEGDFQNNGEIIAEKVRFLDFIDSGGNDCMQMMGIC